MAWVFGLGVALFLLLAFPKQVGVLVAIVLLVAGLAVGYSWLEAKEKQRRLDKLTVVARYAPDACPTDFPILISFHNGGNDIVELISFNLVGYRPGYSNALSSAYSRNSDKILAPNEGHRSCWSFYRPTYGDSFDAATLQWTVELNYAKYKGR